jgi:hypothetical protein
MRESQWATRQSKGRTLTVRRTPIPVKITAAGGYTYEINIRGLILN